MSNQAEYAPVHPGCYQAEVTKQGVLDCQVCVPDSWTVDKIVAFANSENPCGTTHGWQMRRAGDDLLRGAPERQPCAERSGWVHVMFDA